MKKEERKKSVVWQNAADNITKVAGSWTFIISFFVFLMTWIILNSFSFFNHWDDYPFILLNLVLSCVASIQAPIILMSQNRVAEIDRHRSEYDYAVNRKTEREIQILKEQLNRIEKKLNK